MFYEDHALKYCVTLSKYFKVMLFTFSFATDFSFVQCSIHIFQTEITGLEVMSSFLYPIPTSVICRTLKYTILLFYASSSEVRLDRYAF